MCSPVLPLVIIQMYGSQSYIQHVVPVDSIAALCQCFQFVICSGKCMQKLKSSAGSVLA